MDKLAKLVLVLAILAVIGALVSTVHTYMEQERWAWYDAGYDDALADNGIVYINGRMYLEDCPLGVARTHYGR